MRAAADLHLHCDAVRDVGRLVHIYRKGLHYSNSAHLHVGTLIGVYV